jgi:putative ATP-dependent endonuclease of OLD family
MRIQAVHVRRFKSVESASLLKCGPLNVLIGKNNAGKSNLLAAIDQIFAHLKRGTLAGTWNTERPLDEVTGRNSANVVEIGLECELSQTVNEQLRTRLANEGPHLAKSIEQLVNADKISFVLGGAIEPRPFLYVQSIAIGPIRWDQTNLVTPGISLLSVSTSVGAELASIQESVAQLRSDLAGIEELRRISPRELEAMFASESNVPRRYYIDRALSGSRLSQPLQGQVTSVLRTSQSSEEFSAALSQFQADIKNGIKTVEEKQTEGSIRAFAGEVKTPPAYATWLMETFGSTPLLHLRESKQPIGRSEAQALLNLKITRGGPERLRNLQQKVKSLLGVNIDAFAADSRETGRSDRSAEMDIDEFLVEVNGAGIREALRIILDLELKAPSIALIEEPEVHLHPGLERALEGYLKEKSDTIQMFVTTHSTNFIDAVAYPNVYLVSRNNTNTTKCESLSTGDTEFKLPAELGLRLSTVFMFDHLVFVEGPTDEAILRALAALDNIEIIKGNVGFVHMSGARNFAYYAAEHTLDLLSRRQIDLTFVLDRDEAEDVDVARMAERLGNRASLHTLQKRELENYLLDPEAVRYFIQRKQGTSEQNGFDATPAQIADDIQEAAEGLKEEVIRLRLVRKVLCPVHLMRRGNEGDVADKLRAGIQSLENRLQALEESNRAVTEAVDAKWPAGARDLAPGSVILEKVCEKYRVKFDKMAGHGAQIACLMRAAQIPSDLKPILRLLGQ